jgi:hypothetical protein
MPYLEVALKAGSTILVEDERSPEAFSRALAENDEVTANRVEVFDTDQKYEVVLTDEDVAGVAAARDL